MWRCVVAGVNLENSPITAANRCHVTPTSQWNASVLAEGLGYTNSKPISCELTTFLKKF